MPLAGLCLGLFPIRWLRKEECTVHGEKGFQTTWQILKLSFKNNKPIKWIFKGSATMKMWSKFSQYRLKPFLLRFMELQHSALSHTSDSQIFKAVSLLSKRHYPKVSKLYSTKVASFQNSFVFIPIWELAMWPSQNLFYFWWTHCHLTCHIFCLPS